MNPAIAGLIEAMSRDATEFEGLANRLEEIADDMARIERRKAKTPVYHRDFKAVADHVRSAQVHLADLSTAARTTVAALALQEHPWAVAPDGDVGRPYDGPVAWALLADALSRPGSGSAFVGTGVSKGLVKRVKSAVDSIARAGGNRVGWERDVWGSWFAKLNIWAKQKGHDKTLARAAKVHIHDRFDAPAFRSYAEGLSSMVRAAESADEIVMLAPGAMLVKGIDPTTRAKRVVARHLTKAEIEFLDTPAGQMYVTDPELAMAFLSGDSGPTSPDALEVEGDDAA